MRRDTSAEGYFEHTPTVLHVKTESVNICQFSPVSLTFSSISPAQNKCIPQMIQYVWHDAGVRTTLQKRTSQGLFYGPANVPAFLVSMLLSFIFSAQNRMASSRLLIKSSPSKWCGTNHAPVLSWESASS